MNEPDAYTIELIRAANEGNYYSDALQATDELELYRHTKHRLTKKTKARVRETLALEQWRIRRRQRLTLPLWKVGG